MKPPAGGVNKGTGGALRERDILRSRNTRTLKPENTANIQISISQCGSSSSKPPTDSSSDSSESPTTSGSNVSTPEDAGSSRLKGSAEEGGSSGSKGAEMRMYLEKLRDMVPYAPSSGKINKVDLIHSAIDYISDLQEALEARARRKLREKGAMQSQRSPLSSLPTAAHSTGPNTTPLQENGTNRPPTQLEANTSHPDAIVDPSPASSTSNTHTSQVLTDRSNSTSLNTSSSSMDTDISERRIPMNMNIPSLQNFDVSSDESFQRTLESMMSISAPSVDSSI